MKLVDFIFGLIIGVMGHFFVLILIMLSLFSRGLRKRNDFLGLRLDDDSGFGFDGFTLIHF